MISWTQIKDDLWLVKADEYVKKAKSVQDLIFISLVLEINIDEIEEAILELNRNDHNFAEFGMNKTLTYTRKIGI